MRKKIFIIIGYLFCILLISCSNIAIAIDEEITIETEEKEDKKVDKKNERLVLKTIEKKQFFSDSIKVLVTSSDKEIIMEKIPLYEEELIILAKIIYREARGIKDTSHKAAVVWCILNRVDSDIFDGDTIKEIATAPHQFCWVEKTPVKEEFYELAKDVIIRWELEKMGYSDVGRVLPKEYTFFAAHKKINRFRTGYRTKDYWDWSLESPYLEE